MSVKKCRIRMFRVERAAPICRFFAWPGTRNYEGAFRSVCPDRGRRCARPRTGPGARSATAFRGDPARLGERLTAADLAGVGGRGHRDPAGHRAHRLLFRTIRRSAARDSRQPHPHRTRPRGDRAGRNAASVAAGGFSPARRRRCCLRSRRCRAGSPRSTGPVWWRSWRRRSSTTSRVGCLPPGSRLRRSTPAESPACRSGRSRAG